MTLFEILIVFFDTQIKHAMKYLTSTKCCTPSNQRHVPLVGVVSVYYYTAFIP